MLNYTFLIIEDDVLLCEEISITLNDADIDSIDKAYNADSIVDFIQEKKFDIIICDVNLNSKKNGIEIINQYELYKKSEIIIVTAYNDHQTLTHIANIPNSLYINKPFNDNQLLSTVQLAICRIEKKNQNIFNLTKREKEILELIVHGHSNKEIAAKLNISFFTVDNHRKQIYAKTGATNVCELMNLIK